MSAYNTLITILKRSEGRDQFCGMGSAACELAAWHLANPNTAFIDLPSWLGLAPDQAREHELAFTKASKSFGSNRRWLRFALSIYDAPSVRRKLIKFKPATASVDDWRSHVGSVAGFLSAVGDDISVLGDLGVLPKSWGKAGGAWSCRLWFFCAVLGTWGLFTNIIRTCLKIRRLQAAIAARGGARYPLESKLEATAGSGGSGNGVAAAAPSVSSEESVADLRRVQCVQAVDVVTSGCDLIWSSSCAFSSLNYSPPLVAAAAFLTQAVGFNRYWRRLRTQLAAEAAAASATRTK